MTKLIELNTYKNLPRIYIKIDKIFIPKTKLICEYLCLCESWQHLYKYFVYFLNFKLAVSEILNNNILYFSNDVWFLLTLSGQYYIPNKNKWSIKFLIDVLSGKKKQFKIKCCRQIKLRILNLLLFLSLTNLDQKLCKNEIKILSRNLR